MKKINKILDKNLKNIIIIFMLIQPIIDTIAGISQNYLKTTTTISSIIRLIFILICTYYILILDKTNNKKKNIKYLSMILLYTIIFSLITIKYKDINAYKFEIKNILNVFYLPITLLAMIDVFKQYNIKFKLKHILYIYLTYIILILIPNLTNTAFLSYSHSKLGSVGWFTSANSIGNILSILMPLIILYITKINKNKILSTIIILTGIYALVSMGTKVPILSLIICLIINIIYYIIKCIKEKNKKQILLCTTITILTTIISIILVPKTSFYKNIQIHKNYLGFDSYTEIFTNYELLDHFIFSQRLTFLKNTSINYKNSHISEKIFGIGYIENYGTDQINTKTIEIDYFEILYRNGIIGFALFFSIVLPILFNSIKKIKQNTLQNIELKLCISLILILSLFSGHVLVTPSVSIFISLIISIILQGGIYEKIN